MTTMGSVLQFQFLEVQIAKIQVTSFASSKDYNVTTLQFQFKNLILQCYYNKKKHPRRERVVCLDRVRPTHSGRNSNLNW